MADVYHNRFLHLPPVTLNVDFPPVRSNRCHSPYTTDITMFLIKTVSQFQSIRVWSPIVTFYALPSELRTVLFTDSRVPAEPLTVSITEAVVQPESLCVWPLTVVGNSHTWTLCCASDIRRCLRVCIIVGLIFLLRKVLRVWEINKQNLMSAGSCDTYNRSLKNKCKLTLYLTK